MDRNRDFMREALRLARRGYGTTSPNPMVGAVLVRRGEIIGRGWHHRAGEPHAEIEALRDAIRNGFNPKGATLYVTLEPCSTHGRTPPCTDAIKAAEIRCVNIGAQDPNPKHRGRAAGLLRKAGIQVRSGLLEEECTRLNEAFNHWIVRRQPFVTVKAAMTLDGKIATASGESKWITGERARAAAMRLRQGTDAILVGINTILADDPSLTARPPKGKQPRRIVLDTHARTPLHARVVTDSGAALTTIVVGEGAPKRRIEALRRRVPILVSPLDPSRDAGARIDLHWLLRHLGQDNVTSLLVESGGEVGASFLLHRMAQHVVFFYAPKILGGKNARRAVAGRGARNVAEAIALEEVRWSRLDLDWMLTARVALTSGAPLTRF